MKFVYNKKARLWMSDCGNYKVWLQGRPRDDLPEWAAQFRDEKWLTRSAASRREAQQICREDELKLSS